MIWMIKKTLLPLLAFSVFAVSADQYGPPSSSPRSSIPPPPSQPSKTQPAVPQVPHPLLPKPVLPPMVKPFGMPGVIGLQEGKWEGTDYLGYLSDHIAIDVEILKPETVQVSIDRNELHKAVAAAFEKQDLFPNTDVKEGPPLPFLHFLVVIYPVDRDKYVVVVSTRLFEQIQVLRKDFIPGGYWQGITWENQDVTIATANDLPLKVKELVDKLANAFTTRYRQYNLNRPPMPGELPQR